ncbi:MAG: hypothetical protein JSS81_09830 [Acidobacteria bacterium]|nr:hypothetical protein [Acidobacteriota bacterium]
MNDEFYIGYLPKMPKAAAKAIRVFVVTALLAALGFAGLAWLGQKPFARSVFEFGTVRDFEGTIEARPIPFLIVEKPEKTNDLPAFERIPLVAEGKHGFDGEMFDGRRVRLKGTLVYRDELRMIEVAGGSVEPVPEAAKPFEEKTEALGDFTLRGEIVDSKCYLGVMNPGATKPHRDCAVACLRGGIPPLFVVKDAAGNTSELWLLSEKGEAVNREVLDYVAEPVALSGAVVRRGDRLFFRIDPRRIERLP